MPRSTSAYHRCQESMQALVARVRQLDVGAFESAPREVLSADLRPRTTSIIAQANQIVREVLDTCEGLEEADGLPPTGDTTLPPAAADFEVEMDTAVRSSAFSTSRIADIAFMAQVELRQRAKRVASVEHEASSMLVAECDSALRRVTKALCALDRAIARASDTPAYLDYVSELDLSLRVRACYASFRRQVVMNHDDPTTLDEVQASLRRTGNEIAVLVGMPIYPALRLHDRVQLRALQQRILAWLREGASDLASGQHLWRDVTSFVAILRHVDRRQELFEHDARAVFHALDSFQMGGLTENDFVRLRSLAGRDDEVDFLLGSGSRDAVAWGDVLERLAAEIGTRHLSSRP